MADLKTKINEIMGALNIKPLSFECPEIGQTPDELTIELKAVRLLQPRTIVEIGSASGGHIYLLSAVLDSDREHRIISIDPLGRHKISKTI